MDRQRPLRAATALAAGLVVFLASCLLEAPVFAPTGMGIEYAHQAREPFGLGGDYPHRLLGPVVGHLLQLHGERYAWLHHGAGVLLLAVVFAAAVSRGARRWHALVLALALASTSAVRAYKTAVGYPDPLTFALLLAAAMAVRGRWFWWWWALGLCNHEIVLLFTPWLVCLRWQASGRLSAADGLRIAALLAGYVAFRACVGMLRPTGTSTLAFYLGGATVFTVDAAAMLGLFVIVVLIGNGVLPVLLCWQAFDAAERRGRIAALCYLLGLAVTPFLAVDLWRFAGFLLVPLVHAGAAAVQRPRGVLVVAVLGCLTAAGSDLQFQVFERLARQVVANGATGESHLVLSVLRDQWPVALGYALLLGAMVAIGRLLAGRLRADRVL